VHLMSPAAGTPGAVIASVVSGGPGDRAGLQSGDTITALNGDAVTSPDSLLQTLLRLSPGTTVRFDYVDQFDQQQHTDVTLGSGPPQ
jgi:S1-C subfamily serine protease